MKAKNGILKGEIKIKGGKLLRCTIEVCDGKIKKARITGDFFMHPEEEIEKFEGLLENAEYEEEELKNKIEGFFENVTVIGASPSDFIKLLMQAKLKS
ncbi:MAG: hypothetical protein J7K61_06035 [Thermoplasmata archaeon]|nr:hypothetical protein [Thermoplasmata archaeon]